MNTVQSTRDLNLKLRCAADMNELIGAAFSVNGLILLEEDLAPEFLDLRTGLLGELFQKLANYRIPTAFVTANPAAHGLRFAELAYEHAKHPHVRFFTLEAEARAWLESFRQ